MRPVYRHIVTAEIVLGALPISLLAAAMVPLGLMFSTTSLSLMLYYGGDATGYSFWLTVLGLSLGGMIGLLGIWSLLVVPPARLKERPPWRRLVSAAAAVGIVTALWMLAQAIRADTRPAVLALHVYVLAAPIVVAGRRLWLLAE